MSAIKSIVIKSQAQAALANVPKSKPKRTKELVVRLDFLLRDLIDGLAECDLSFLEALAISQAEIGEAMYYASCNAIFEHRAYEEAKEKKVRKK